jgi:hypothetical protein
MKLTGAPLCLASLQRRLSPLPTQALPNARGVFPPPGGPDGEPGPIHSLRVSAE